MLEWMRELISNSADSSSISSITNTSQVTNIMKSWFWNSRYVFNKWQIVIENNTKIASKIIIQGMILLGKGMVGSLSLKSCCGIPKMRNSVLEGFRKSYLENIQLDTLVVVFSKWAILWEKSKAVIISASELTLWLRDFNYNSLQHI